METEADFLLISIILVIILSQVYLSLVFKILNLDDKIIIFYFFFPLLIVLLEDIFSLFSTKYVIVFFSSPKKFSCMKS